MKRLIILAAAAMVTTLTFAQDIPEKDVPTLVKTAFQKQFPSVKEVEWEKDGNNFEAEFELNKTEQSALFDAQGNLIETEMEIEVGVLPTGVSDYIDMHYPGQKVKEASKITDAGGTITYEVEIKGIDLIFDSTGKFIREEKDIEEDKED